MANELYVPPRYATPAAPAVQPSPPPETETKLTVQDYRDMTDYAISLEVAADRLLTRCNDLIAANQRLSEELEAAKAEIKRLKK